jgi:hypothetical protein
MSVPGRDIEDARTLLMLDTVFGRNPKVFTVLPRCDAQWRRTSAPLLP